MEVLYRSTRGNGSTVTASNAILKGLSEDGGLFVPDQIPALEVPMEQLAQMSYQEVAYEVMSRFLTDFTEEELKNCIDRAYDSKFDTPDYEIASAVRISCTSCKSRWRLLSGVISRIYHCFQRYGSVDSSISADNSSKEKRCDQ